MNGPLQQIVPSSLSIYHMICMQVTVDTHEFKMVGPPPQKFAVGDGMLVDIATAALPALLRLGTGALNVGGWDLE